MYLKLPQNKTFKKAAKATGDLIGKKITNEITKFSKVSKQNNPETVAHEYDNETFEKKYVSPEERQEIADELRLKQ